MKQALALPAAKVPTLPTLNGWKGTLQLDVFGGFVNVIPATAEPFAVEEVASHYCEECCVDTAPIKARHHGAWVEGEWFAGWIIFPCHTFDCSSCSNLVNQNESGRCDNCETCFDCCDCSHCEYCSEAFNDGDVCSACNNCDNHCSCVTCDGCGNVGAWDHLYKCDGCGNCEYCGCNCEQDDCNCDDCTPSRRGNTVPGWVLRNDPIPEMQASVKHDVLRDDLSAIDPVEAMASFYVSEYVMFRTASAGMPIINPEPWRGFSESLVFCGCGCEVFPSDNPNGNGGAGYGYRIVEHDKAWRGDATRRHDWKMADLWIDAKRVHEALIARCDGPFRDYVFAACAGEVRHHSNVESFGTGRGSQWDAMFAMAEQNGNRVQLIRDMLELFSDGSWSGGFGGEAWAVCARVLLMREEGKLDAKSFVDRVFALQHNGGSLLNKMGWRSDKYSVGYCLSIGNAHAAEQTDFRTLLDASSSDAIDLAYRLWNMPAAWTDGPLDVVYGGSGTAQLEADRGALEHALRTVGKLEPFPVCDRCGYSQDRGHSPYCEMNPRNAGKVCNGHDGWPVGSYCTGCDTYTQ